MFSKFHPRGAREQFSWKSPLLDNFLTVRPTSTINIPIDSSWLGEKSRIFNKVPNFTLGEPRGTLFVKNTPKNYFSTNEPIFTDNIPIDSAWQAETYRNFKIFQNRFRGAIGEFSSEKYPLEYFLNRSIDFHKIECWSIQFNIYFAKQQI
jgi:hypothetical protein